MSAFHQGKFHTRLSPVLCLLAAWRTLSRSVGASFSSASFEAAASCPAQTARITLRVCRQYLFAASGFCAGGLRGETPVNTSQGSLAIEGLDRVACFTGQKPVQLWADALPLVREGGTSA
jgi:hypothetical protein